jgi:phosphatidylinositol 4-kinase
LSPYLSESYTQILFPSPGLRDIEPSPHEALAGSLTSAILSIGVSHGHLRAQVTDAITAYLNGWASTAAELSADQFDDDDRGDYSAEGELARVLTQSLSLLGFLSAAAEYAGFWSAYDRLQLVENIRAMLSENFLIAFETALSIVRNARSHHHGLREWRHYVKHYAAIGRPLGSMVLHDGFMKVVEACAALLVGTPSHNPRESVLDFLRTSFNSAQLLRTQSDEALLDGLTRISIDEMERLHNDLDYLQRVGSAWQQRQAAAVEAKILTTYMCCTVYDEDVADSDLLLSWLDSTFIDPVQTSDDTLASTALKVTAVLAKVDSSIASTLSRSLPRVIVQGGFDQRTSDVAAECLASVLSLLPQDAIITTLYSLGNVIGAGPVPNGGAISPTPNGAAKSSRNTVYNHETGSALSLTPSDAEDPHHVHTTVVQTVVSVARNCKDEKVTALALSMLLQKIGRSSKAVDAKIISDSALLGIHSGPGEFKLLLKIYLKLCHEALVNGDEVTLEAVSIDVFVGNCVTANV